MLSEMGINVVESEDAEEADKESGEAADEEEPEGGEIVEASRSTQTTVAPCSGNWESSSSCVSSTGGRASDRTKASRSAG